MSAKKYIDVTEYAGYANLAVKYDDGNHIYEKYLPVIDEQALTEIPKDYVYSTETKYFKVYKHKYTGEEIHVEKPLGSHKSIIGVDGGLVNKRMIKNKMILYGFKAPDMTVTEFVEDCLPVVNLPQVEGKWLETQESDDAEPMILWYCDQCTGIQRRRTAYCPNCGAKMEV